MTDHQHDPGFGSLDADRPTTCPVCDLAAQLGCDDACSAIGAHDEPHWID